MSELVSQNIIKQCLDWRTLLPTAHELDAAAEHASHVRAGDLHDVDGGGGHDGAHARPRQEPAEVDEGRAGGEEDGQEAEQEAGGGEYSTVQYGTVWYTVPGGGEVAEGEPPPEPLHGDPGQQAAQQTAYLQHARCKEMGPNTS